MILWSILTLMTIGALFSVVWPLMRRGATSARSGTDLAVYNDQLDEIGRDEAASLIGKVEAEAARVEVSRRLIAAAEAANAGRAVAGAARGRVYRLATLGAAVILIPLGASAVYLSLGSPALVPASMNAGLSAEPGGAANQSSIEATVAEVEAYLQKNPRNGRGWELLAPVYLRLGRFDDAVTARRNALEIFGPDAARLGDLGEAMVMAAGGAVTAEAKGLFERAAAADPEDVMAQYYLGLAAKQDGRRDEAEKRWRALVSSAPAGAEWLPLVQNALARIDEKTPTAMVAAPEQRVAPPEHNGDTIEAMVERLAQRLKNDGSDVAGWVQLVRSYRVLGKPDRAKAATAEARAALANNQESLQQLDEGLQALEAAGVPTVSASGPAGQTRTAAASPGPSADDVAAAAQMGTAERNDMIASMVARLAQRMAQDGSDVDGWLRLIRAYSVLGERANAQTAAANARQALAGNSDSLRRIGELTKELGLEGS
jgi:cytochrome c-type biogenesis protein CcmH